jgi:hypothetical protein
MADFFTRVPGPLEVMRRMGLNVPSSKQLGKFSTAVPEFVGPQADVAGMVRDAGQVMPNIQAGDYGQALGNLGMAAAAIPFMAFPGTVKGVKNVVDFGQARKMKDLENKLKKDELMAYREQGQPMPDKYRDAFAGQEMKRTPLSKEDVSDIIDDLEGRIGVRLDDGEFVEAEKLQEAIDILSKKMKASNDQFIFYTGRDAEILDSIENLADIKLRNE